MTGDDPLDGAERLANDAGGPGLWDEENLDVLEIFEEYLEDQQAWLDREEERYPTDGDHEADEGHFEYVMVELCALAGLDEIPHPSNIAAFAGGPVLTKTALVAGARAHAAIDQYPAEQRAAVAEIADDASMAAFFYVLHRFNVGLRRDHADLKARFAELVDRSRKNTAAATAARRIQSRPEEAAAAWAKKPGLTPYAVAKMIAKPGEDVSSVARSIRKFRPTKA